MMCKNKKLISLRLEPDLLDWVDELASNMRGYNRSSVIGNLLLYLKTSGSRGIIQKMIIQAYRLEESKQVKLCLKENHVV